MDLALFQNPIFLYYQPRLLKGLTLSFSMYMFSKAYAPNNKKADSVATCFYFVQHQMVKVLVEHGILRFSQAGTWVVTFEKNPALCLQSTFSFLPQ